MAFPRRSTSSNAIGSPITDGTVGSVLFVGPGPALAQDNALLYWDDTNGLLNVVSAAQGKGALLVGVTAENLGYVEVESANDMQILQYALVVTTKDNGGASSVNIAGLLAKSRSTHTSGALTTSRAIVARAQDAGGGGTVTTMTAIDAGCDGATVAGTAIGLNVQNITGAANNFAIKTGTGQVSFGDVMRLPGVAIASLPASPAVGMIMRVTDSLTPVLGATVSAGGSTPALVWYNGTNWTVIGK